MGKTTVPDVSVQTVPFSDGDRTQTEAYKRKKMTHRNKYVQKSRTMKKCSRSKKADFKTAKKSSKRHNAFHFF